jgi:uncharacterized membrane protein
MTTISTAEPDRNTDAAKPTVRLISSSRLDVIDLVRGLVMVIMALDHVRDFFAPAGFDPTDLSRTTAAWFFTRWISHYCAPVFVFLAGTGAFLYGCRGRTKSEVAAFLFTRGLWLVFLELTLVNLGWSFNFQYQFVLLQVIWVIGWSMVTLSALIFLPTWLVAALGLLLIGGHNYFAGARGEELIPIRWLRAFLLSGDQFQIEVPGWHVVRVVLAYPLLPWLGVMCAGYGFGALWLLPPKRRRPLIAGLGVAATLLFLVLRYLNGYGDLFRWSEQSSNLFTFLSFINCWKYPPSLLFVLMTLGPAMIVLALFDRPTGPVSGWFVLFGRVPLFYYLLHVPLIHIVAIICANDRYGETAFLLKNPLFFDRQAMPSGYGYGLPIIYMVWIGIVLALHPACEWFAYVKRRWPTWWLSYL